MLGFVRFSHPISRALSGEYPARIAAWVAFRSIKYSSTNRFCFLVKVFTPFQKTIRGRSFALPRILDDSIIARLIVGLCRVFFQTCNLCFFIGCNFGGKLPVKLLQRMAVKFSHILICIIHINGNFFKPLEFDIPSME